jgi:integrase
MLRSARRRSSFTSTTGNPLYRGAFWPSVWKPAVKNAGLDGLRIHDLRHTYVSLMIAAGANPKEVSTWAGHSSVSFTLDRYGHLYDEHGDDVADRLDVLLSQGRPPFAPSDRPLKMQSQYVSER